VNATHHAEQPAPMPLARSARQPPRARPTAITPATSTTTGIIATRSRNGFGLTERGPPEGHRQAHEPGDQRGPADGLTFPRSPPVPRVSLPGGFSGGFRVAGERLILSGNFHHDSVREKAVKPVSRRVRLPLTISRWLPDGQHEVASRLVKMVEGVEG